MSLWKRLFGSGKEDESKPQPDSAAAGPAKPPDQRQPNTPPPSTEGASSCAKATEDRTNPLREWRKGVRQQARMT